VPEPYEPLVSVIVPAYEGERFLGEALDSVRAQTYANVETIVVDDGSPDACAEIAEARGDVRLLREPHGGVAAARNAGLRAAGGELIAFIDQDDEWLPERLARGVAAMAARPELAIVMSHLEILLLPGARLPAWMNQQWLTEPIPGFIPSTWLARRSAFDQVGDFDTSYVTGCDTDWLARMKGAGLIAELLPEALVRWRIHGANGSYDLEVMQSEYMRAIRASVRRKRLVRDAG
jgi:glycosyltransferase involved in cell wall biosynthesis